ncbi:MAG: ABC transporter ATP-binding protein, partial [Oscillospiraceae bacterium]|nr:ABC transporter ATP-binding protein [Oscillospiraceae bacterium]
MADKILEVKNLKISFRTSSGTLKAVRDISFDLYRGRTLAIVGESGSGKSVTSKAILGILAGNSIIENGEILYDGMDLLKLDEETMHTIRGDKISMIFQDPLSSLNPIVKIGPQITEAMLLKNKAGRKNARKDFNSLLGVLKTNMQEACPSDSAHIEEMAKTFDNFCIEANKLEDSYNRSDSNAQDLKEDITNFLYMHSKKQKQSVKQLVSEQIKKLRNIKDSFYTHGFEADLEKCLNAYNTAKGNYKADKKDPSFVNDDLLAAMEETGKLLDRMSEQVRPNFFRIGYYRMVNPEEDIYGYDRNELNEKALQVLDDRFMKEFLSYSSKGLRNSYDKAEAGKKEAIAALREAETYFSSEIEQKPAEEYAKTLIEKVESGIDYLEVNKDSYAYTFKSSLNGAIDKYFFYVENNPKEEERFEKQTAKREALIAKGKTVDWKVVPKNILDLDEL